MTDPDKDGYYDIGRSKYMYEESKMVLKTDPKTGETEEKEEIVLKVYKQRVVDWFLTPQPVIFDGLKTKKKVIDVACGERHLLVVAREPGNPHGSVYACGMNDYGQVRTHFRLNMSTLVSATQSIIFPVGVREQLDRRATKRPYEVCRDALSEKGTLQNNVLLSVALRTLRPNVCTKGHETRARGHCASRSWSISFAGADARQHSHLLLGCFG